MEERTKVTANYGEGQIQVLEGLDPVRKRPGMYIGSTDVKGLHHLVQEIVDNSIDEALSGYCDTIVVTLNADGSCSVTDNGRGIPTAMHHTEKISAVEVVLTKLHAGGKFGGGGYKISGGLHGVGLSVVNALSEWLEVEVFQNGNHYKQIYNRGVPQAPLKVIGTADRTGTKVTFYPDDEIFETIIFNYDTIKIRLRELAYLNKGLTIRMEDRRAGQERSDSFYYEGGIAHFVEDLNKTRRRCSTSPSISTAFTATAKWRSPYSTTTAIRRPFSPLRTTSTPRRAALIWTGSRTPSPSSSTTPAKAGRSEKRR